MATAKTLIEGRINYLKELEKVRKQINSEHLIGRSIKKSVHSRSIKTARALFTDNRRKTSLITESYLNFDKNRGKKLPKNAGNKLSKALQPVMVENNLEAEQGITA